ncbi:MAG: F0F1 ATP synthase subunit A [Hyphomicrobiales bacterium]
MSGFALDPMHQFKVTSLIKIPFGTINADFTNASLWMVIGVVFVLVVMLAGPRKLVPGRLQSVAEMAYEFVANMLRDTVGDAGRPFFPFIFTLFAFIMAMNLQAMLPGSFAVTSHVIVTFALALVVFVGATVVGFVKHGARYLRLFVPSGVPIVLLPMLAVIEVISYFTRPISLSIRLFANMMAGHTMLKVFGGFVVGLGLLAGWVPLAVTVAVFALEVLVAFLQAYVFCVLACIYLNDAIHMHDH